MVKIVGIEPQHIKNPEAVVKITLAEACKLISKETGLDITPETHWIDASIELTRDCPPFAMVKLQAYKR